MSLGWRGAHEQLPVNDLVTIAVFGQTVEVVGCPLPLDREHMHTTNTSAPSEQGNMTATWTVVDVAPTTPVRDDEPISDQLQIVEYG